MFSLTGHTVLTADRSLGKVDKSTLSQQTLMELLVSDFADKAVYRDSDGSFTDIHDWTSVTVNDCNEVIEINWKTRLPVVFDKKGGSIDFQWLPSTIKNFGVAGQKLRGTIQTSDLPRSLEIFFVFDNFFKGTFHVGGLPRGLIDLQISRSTLSGSFDLTSLPPRLANCSADENIFAGALDFRHLPPSLEYLSLSHNRFSGEIDLSALPVSLENLTLHANEFSQEELRVANGGNCRCIIDRGHIRRILNTDGLEVNPLREDYGTMEVMF